MLFWSKLYIFSRFKISSHHKYTGSGRERERLGDRRQRYSKKRFSSTLYLFLLYIWRSCEILYIFHVSVLPHRMQYLPTRQMRLDCMSLETCPGTYRFWRPGQNDESKLCIIYRFISDFCLLDTDLETCRLFTRNAVAVMGPTASHQPLPSHQDCYPFIYAPLIRQILKIIHLHDRQGSGLL